MESLKMWTIMDAIMPLNQASKDTTPAPPVPQANNTTTQDPVMQFTKMVQVLQDKVDKLSKAPVLPKNINPKTGKPWK